MHLLITGFTGAGKSYLLQKLRGQVALNGYKLFDSDSEIEARHALKGERLADLIKRVGFHKFRELEESVIFDLCSEHENLVGAVGAGAITESLLAGLGRLKCPPKRLFLDVPLEICLKRVVGDTSRPLTIMGADGLREIYLERFPRYESAEFRLRCEEITEQEIEFLLSIIKHDKQCRTR